MVRWAAWRLNRPRSPRARLADPGAALSPQCLLPDLLDHEAPFVSASLRGGGMGAQEPMTLSGQWTQLRRGHGNLIAQKHIFFLPKLFPQLDLGVPACKAGHLPRRVNEGLGFLHSAV